MRLVRALPALSLAGAPAGALPAGARTLPDGRHECSIGGTMPGEIAIERPVDRGPAFDGAFEGDHPDMMDGPTILRGGPPGGITSSGTVASRVVRESDDGNVQTRHLLRVRLRALRRAAGPRPRRGGWHRAPRG